MDQNLLPKSDIRPYVALPKDWQPEGKHNRANKMLGHKQYPRMPLVPNSKEGRAPEPIYLDRERLKPLIFQTARDETEWLKANPEKAALIAEVDAQASGPAHDKLEASNKAMRAAAAKIDELSTERNSLEQETSDLRDQLAAAKAELEAALAQRKGASAQVQDEDAVETPVRKKPGRKSKAEIQAAMNAGSDVG